MTSDFHLTGLLKKSYGSRACPVGYGYDAPRRMTLMTNWSGFAGGTGARVTTWVYSTNRAWLTKKLHAGETSDSSPDYDYTAAGRLRYRYWERGTNTTYSYNTAGDLYTVVYSDSTPAATNTYDRRGRLSTTICNGMATTRYYDEQSHFLGEKFIGGTLNGLLVTNTFDAFLRRQTVTSKITGERR